jgi:hypothetical protein
MWAAVRSVFGTVGVSLIPGITVLIVAFLLFRAGIHRGAGHYAAAATSAVAVISMAPFISARPLLVGFILFPITIAAANAFRSGSSRSLVLVALLVAAWSNLHGSFVTGVATVGLIAVGWAIDEREWLRPAALAATVIVAGVLNPFGVSAYLHTLDVRDESVNIDEWQPLALDDARSMVLVAFMVVTVWSLWRLMSRAQQPRAASGQQRRWEEALPIVALALATMSVIRTGAFFILLATPIVAASVSGLEVARLRAWAAPRRGPITTGLVLAGAMLAAQQVSVVADAGDLGERFSVDAVAAIPANCTLLNEYDIGGFIIDQRWPEVLVSQDGRNDLYGAAEIERQEELLRSSDAEALTGTGITCVLADRDRPLVAALSGPSGWEVRAESLELVLLVRD